MTLKEVREEMNRLRILERELLTEEREEYQKEAQRVVGKCYRRDDGIVFKIISTPLVNYTGYGESYNPYQFPAVFVRCPQQLQLRSYKHNYLEDLDPCYCDTIYFDIYSDKPDGLATSKHSYDEITVEEFNAEFDKCIALFKEMINT